MTAVSCVRKNGAAPSLGWGALILSLPNPQPWVAFLKQK